MLLDFIAITGIFIIFTLPLAVYMFDRIGFSGFSSQYDPVHHD